MKLFKKGQGISLNVIIIAAIALIVLVVLVMIFTGRMKLFGEGLSGTEISCINDRGGQVRTVSDGCLPGYHAETYRKFSDVTDTNSICCVPD